MTVHNFTVTVTVIYKLFPHFITYPGFVFGKDLVNFENLKNR